MWPQKWYASAFCARIASSTKPPPASARMALPVAPRQPRLELASATRSLSTDEGLQLVERGERALGKHDAVRVEHDGAGGGRGGGGPPPRWAFAFRSTTRRTPGGCAGGGRRPASAAAPRERPGEVKGAT